MLTMLFNCKPLALLICICRYHLKLTTYLGILGRSLCVCTSTATIRKATLALGRNLGAKYESTRSTPDSCSADTINFLWLPAGAWSGDWTCNRSSLYFKKLIILKVKYFYYFFVFFFSKVTSFTHIETSVHITRLK